MSKRFGAAIIGAIMVLLFAVTFWAQIGTMATSAAAGRKHIGSFAGTSAPYLPLRRLEPVY